LEYLFSSQSAIVLVLRTLLSSTFYYLGALRHYLKLSFEQIFFAFAAAIAAVAIYFVDFNKEQ
jgi:hypothetical protein